MPSLLLTGGAELSRVPRAVSNDTAVTDSTTTAEDQVVIISASVPSGVLLLLLLVALLLGCIAWRVCSRQSRGKRRGSIVISHSYVFQNHVHTYPVQVEDTCEHHFRQLHGQNVFYNPTTQRIEKVPNPVSTVTYSSTSSSPSSSDGYSGHGFHPPPPTPVTSPSAFLSDQCIQPRDSFRSAPDEVINANPRIAPGMNKSLSCNEALNKSFGVTTFVNIGAGITMGTRNTSNPSLCSSVWTTPVQEGFIPSPRMGRLSLLRRFLGGSRSSVRSNTSRGPEPLEPNVPIYYETPV